MATKAYALIENANGEVSVSIGIGSEGLKKLEKQFIRTANRFIEAPTPVEKYNRFDAVEDDWNFWDEETSFDMVIVEADKFHK